MTIYTKSSARNNRYYIYGFLTERTKVLAQLYKTGRLDIIKADKITFATVLGYVFTGAFT